MTPRQVQILLVTLAVAMALVAVSWFGKRPPQSPAPQVSKKPVIESQVILKGLAKISLPKAIATKDATMSALPAVFKEIIASDAKSLAIQAVTEEQGKGGFTATYTTGVNNYTAQVEITRKLKASSFTILTGSRIDDVSFVEARSPAYEVQALVTGLDTSHSRVVIRITIK